MCSRAMQSLEFLIHQTLMLAIKRATLKRAAADWLIGLKHMNNNRLTRAVNLQL